MARYVAVQTGNWSATATWNRVANTPTIHATTNITVSSGGVTSATFTAPNLVNYVTGVEIFVAAVGSAGNLVATLQVAGVDVASVTVAITSLKVGAFHYLSLATPVLYSTLAAGSYRWKLNTSGASGTTSVAADSGGANFMYNSADDRTAVPTTGDDVDIAGNNLAEVLVTVDDASRLVGSGAATGLPVPRNVTAAINLSVNGKIGWSTTANSTLEVKGPIEVNVDGYLQMGTVATPIPSAYTATLILDQNGTSGNSPINLESTSRFIVQGSAKTSTTLWKTKFVSGLGTAASPLIVSTPVDWSVGDRIVFTGQGAYNHNEERFIITKNSATSYVVSSTLGGAETALVNAHNTNDHVINTSRNCIIKSKTTTESFYIVGKETTSGYQDVDWAVFEYLGGTASGARGYQIVTSSASQVGNCDYSVAYKPIGNGFVWATGKVATTHTGLVCYGGSGAANVGGFFWATSANFKTMVDCFSIGNIGSGFYVNVDAAVDLTRCEAWNNNQSNLNAGGFRFDSYNSSAVIDCSAQANRGRGIYLFGAVDVEFVRYSSGNYGTNTVDIDVVSDIYNKMLFSDSVFGSATLISNYLGMVPGSEIAFDTYQQADNSHRWYSSYGSAQATGPGLSDTVTVFTDHLSARLAPESASPGFQFEFNILAKPGYFVSALGLIKKNSTFGTDDIIVELFLPDSTVADATYTMPDDTAANPFNIGAIYTGTINRLATVRISAQSVAAGAYCYVGRLYNGTNPITALDTWHAGKPAQIIYPELGDPDAVWSVTAAAQVTTGTMGYLVTKLLTVAKFLGLK